MPNRDSLILNFARTTLGWDSPRKRGVRALLRARARSYLTWNRSLLLDPWLRYQPVMSVLGETERASRRLLDAGSGNAGLAYFLHRPVVGLDIRFSSAEMRAFSSPLEPVLGSIVELPFRDAAFDAVVSMDTLEHLPASKRPKAVRELLRVSKDLVVIGFPYGEASSEYDRQALREERRRGVAPPWREEHVVHGLPGEELHAQIMEAAADPFNRWHIEWFGHEGLAGLRMRWRLQALLGENTRLRGILLTPLYVIHSRGHRARAYRRVYVMRSHEEIDGQRG